MDIKIQIFKPEFTSFSVTVKFPCSSSSQSGFKLISDWISYFITLRSTNFSGFGDYGMCLKILRHASFCESFYAEVIHGEDNAGKYVKITPHFQNIDCLNKFINGFEEKVNNSTL